MTGETNVSATIAHAMADPLRVRILIALRSGRRSADSLAAELGVAPHQIRRHARALQTHGFLTEVGDAGRPVMFELVAAPRFSDEAWAQLPTPAKRAALAPIMVAIQSLVSGAVDRGGFDRHDMHLSRKDMAVDEQSWVSLSADLAHLFDRFEQAVIDAESRPRSAAKRFTAHAVLMLFTDGDAGDTTHTSPPSHNFSEQEGRSHALDVYESIEVLLTGQAVNWETVLQRADQLRVIAAAALRSQELLSHPQRVIDG